MNPSNDPSPEEEGHEPLRHLWLVLTPFIIAGVLMWITRMRSLGWLIGSLLLVSGVCSLVWRKEVAEHTRRCREGSIWQMSATANWVTAICWGLFCLLLGTLFLRDSISANSR